MSHGPILLDFYSQVVIIRYSLIAQSVERRTVNPQVGGSNPPRGAKYFGDVAEWSIAADCKSVLNSTVVRIHPSPPNASLTQLVEFLPYTQAVGSSSLSRCTKFLPC